MALDPRLALLTEVPNYSDTFYKGLIQGNNATTTVQQQPIRNRLLEAQTIGAEQGVEERDRALEFDSVLQGALELENIVGTSGDLSPKNKQLAIDYLTRRTNEIQRRGGTPDDTLAALEFLRSDDVNAVRSGIGNVKNVAAQTGRLSAPANTGFTLGAGQTRFDSAGNPIAAAAPKPEKKTPTDLEKLFDLQDSLPANDPRRVQVDAAIRKATSTPGEADFNSVIPQALVEGLTDSVAAKGAAAFQAAGGGKDGVNAYVKVVEKATEQEQRVSLPKLLKNSFPNASPAEFKELEAAALSGKTVESGLNSARDVRVEQRRLKKAKGFQDRAVQLLNKILASDQVGDVTGSAEGAYDFRFSDAEAELIADIDEAQNILTADNMDLMTGVLSESDIKLLKNLSSGGLNRRRGKKRFIQDVTQMRDRLSSQAVLTTDDRAAASGTSPTQKLVYNPATGQLEQAR